MLRYAGCWACDWWRRPAKRKLLYHWCGEGKYTPYWTADFVCCWCDQSRASAAIKQSIAVDPCLITNTEPTSLLQL